MTIMHIVKIVFLKHRQKNLGNPCSTAKDFYYMVVNFHAREYIHSYVHLFNKFIIFIILSKEILK